MDGEQRPLLGAEHQPVEAHGSIRLPAMPGCLQDSGSAVIKCQMCDAIINISGKGNQHVVKCDKCSEATPIKAAPPGKKYVRCSCNCLLICKTTSQKVACPRANCRRVIVLAATAAASSGGAGGQSGGPPAPVDGAAGSGAGAGGAGGTTVSLGVHCGHCGCLFYIGAAAAGGAVDSAARCPRCAKLSSAGTRYARKRGLFYLALALLALGAGLGVTFGTISVAAKNNGIYVIWGGAFVVALALFLRSLMFCCMKVSRISEQNAAIQYT